MVVYTSRPSIILKHNFNVCKKKMPNIEHVNSFYEHCNISPQIIPVIRLDVSLCLCWMAILKALDRFAPVAVWVN